MLEPVTNGWNPDQSYVGSVTAIAPPSSGQSAQPSGYPGTVTALAPPTGQAPAESTRPSSPLLAGVEVPGGNPVGTVSAAVQRGERLRPRLRGDRRRRGPVARVPRTARLVHRAASERVEGREDRLRSGVGETRRRGEAASAGALGGTRPVRSLGSGPVGVWRLGARGARNALCRTTRSPCVGVRGCALRPLIRCSQEIRPAERSPG